MCCFIFCYWLCLQEFYYIDGTELRLNDGTVIKTAEEISEDRFSYFWKEDDETIVVPKQDIKAINYFSLRVPGRQPKKKFKTLRQRRIPGKKVFFDRDGDTYLRFQHVDSAGRNMEGRMAYNLMQELQVLSSEAEKGIEFKFVIDRIRKGTMVSIDFYNYNGKRMFHAKFDMDGKWAAKAVKRRRPASQTFGTAPGLTLERIALVEVYSERKQ